MTPRDMTIRKAWAVPPHTLCLRGLVPGGTTLLDGPVQEEREM
jgi:hypothetical protein